MKYKELLEKISDWLWEVDENGVYTYCSDSVYKFLGYRTDEVIGKTPFDFMSEEEALRVSVLFSAYISNKLPIMELENRHIHKDGHEVIVQSSAIPILDEEGNLTAYHGIDKDVSKEKQLEADLKSKNESMSDLTKLINHSQTIIFHWRAKEHWPVEYVSENISQFGYTKEDFLSGKISYFSIIHPDDSVKVAKEVTEYTLNATNSFSQIYRILTADGDVRWIDDRTVIQRDSDGNAVTYLGTIVDITKRKIAQLSLIDSEEKFKKISENSHTGVFIYKDTYVYINEAFSKLTGYTEEELYKMHPYEILDPIHHKKVIEIMQQRLSGVDLPLGYHDMKLINKRGQKKIVRISTQTIKHENEYAGMGTVVDITDITETKKQLQLLSQAVEQTDELIKITDKDGVILYANDALVAHTGYKHTELLGEKSSIFKSHKHNKKFYEDMWKLILAGQTYRGILINRKKSSELYYEQLTITPIMDSDGEIQNFVSTSEDITERIKMEEKLKQLATIDSLTGIYNRHRTNENIDLELSKASRYGDIFSLAMMDIDHFKSVNDTYGHDVGDSVLQELSSLISNLIRTTDSFGRWGGEEFMLLLPHTNKEQSLILTQKLINVVASHQFKHIEQITISVGVTLYTKDDEKPTILKRVDEALYEAKKSGRNRIVFK